MAVLQRGCCCHLSVCVLTLGIIGAILNGIGLIVSVAAGASIFSLDVSYYNGYDINAYVSAIMTAGIVFYSLQLLVSILLIVAVVKKVKELLIPYMIMNVIQQLYNLAMLVVYGLIVAASPLFGVNMGFTVLFMILYVYCLLCVISHYQNLRDGIDDRAPVTTTIIQQPGVAPGGVVVQHTSSTGYGGPPGAPGYAAPAPGGYGQPPAQPYGPQYGVQQPYGAEKEAPKY